MPPLVTVRNSDTNSMDFGGGFQVVPCRLTGIATVACTRRTMATP